jgi:hypothetical protein
MTVRRQKRLALDESARFAPNDWSSLDIRLLECTAVSFRAATDLNLRLGAAVSIELPAMGWTRACVTWRRSGEFSAKFERPIDLARVRCLSLNREAVLARLLCERAAAHAAGRTAEEQALRGEILRALPLRSLDGTARE